MNCGGLDIRELPEDLAVLLARLGAGLRKLYGERYVGLVLYGSYARGDADDGSDVDLLMLLDGSVDRVQEILRSEDVKWPLALEYGYALSLLPIGAGEYHSSGDPFVQSARREGMPAA